MGLVLYDLVAADGSFLSPNAWRTALTLAHKQQRSESRPTRFTHVAADGDPLHGWIGRCLDLHDGLARRAPGHWPR